MSQNNSYGTIRWYAVVAFALAICLTLTPLAWIISREQSNVSGQTNNPTNQTPPEVTTPEEITTPETTTPEETTPEEPSASDSFVAYTVTVVDENNAPISRAIVQLFVGDKSLIPVLSDDNGVVSILAAEEDYAVRVSLAGYLSEDFYLFAEDSKELTVQLTEIPEETTTVEDPWFVTSPYEGGGVTEENVLKDVSIITGQSESEVYAGEELAAYLTQKNVKVSADGFPVIIVIDPTLGEDAFLVDVTLHGEEASMTIRGGNGRGVLYGVYKFLEKYAGIRYFMPGLELIPEGDIVLFEGNMLSYEPYFEARRLAWNCSKYDTDWNTKNGINGHDGDASDPKYGGKQTYAPGLFVHTLGALSETGGGASANPCLTSEEVYQTVLKNLRRILAENPDSNIVSVSQNDNNTYCQCENCAASDKYYATNEASSSVGGPAGTMLAFVNRIAAELEPDYPDLVIDTLAYNYTQSPPKNIVPRHNVCVRVCSIRVCFMHPMTECNDAKGPNGVQWTRTAQFRQDFLAWGEICDRIYVWDYTTNFAYYIAPFSNFGSIRENMRLYHENGVKGMFPQGNSQSISGEFGELRTYLLAKLMWDPYMSEEEYYQHMDEFLQAYYGEGWEGIRAFIDLTTELAGNEDSCINIYEAPLNSITQEEYLAYEEQIEAWWNNAEALAGDRLEYVQRSRLQWRYIQLLLHPDDDACAQFVEDVLAYGIRWAESDKNNKPLNEMFTNLYPVGDASGDGPQDGEDPMNPQ